MSFLESILSRGISLFFRIVFAACQAVGERVSDWSVKAYLQCHMAGANTIQRAWRCHGARLAIRRQVQDYLARIAGEAAAAEAERAENERQNSPCRSR